MKRLGIAALMAMLFALFLVGTVAAQTFLCSVAGTQMWCQFYDVEYPTPTPYPTATTYPTPLAMPTETPTATVTASPTVAPLWLPSEGHAELFLSRLFRELAHEAQVYHWQPIATPDPCEAK